MSVVFGVRFFVVGEQGWLVHGFEGYLTDTHAWSDDNRHRIDIADLKGDGRGTISPKARINEASRDVNHQS